MIATVLLFVQATVQQNNKTPTDLHNPVLLSPQPSTSNNKTATATLTADSLYLLINAHRLEHMLSQLRSNPTLEQSAQYKLSDMIVNKYYRHTDQNNTPPWPFFLQAGYQYRLAGENLSFAIDTPWQVLNSWVASPTHNEQLLTPEYTDMGVAIDCTTFAQYPDGGCIVVLHLGRE